jgi:hypothetical protein
MISKPAPLTIVPEEILSIIFGTAKIPKTNTTNEMPI